MYEVLLLFICFLLETNSKQILKQTNNPKKKCEQEKELGSNASKLAIKLDNALSVDQYFSNKKYDFYWSDNVYSINIVEVFAWWYKHLTNKEKIILWK